MYPIKWTWGLQHLSRVFDDFKFLGYLVLAWSRPSMAIIKQLSVAPVTVDCSLSVASRHWSVRYAFTLDKCIFWAYSKAAFSFAEWACPIRALKCAHWGHLSLVKHTQVSFTWAYHGQSIIGFYLGHVHDTWKPHGGRGSDCKTKASKPKF